MLVHIKYGLPLAMENTAMTITISAWRMECLAFFPFLHRCMREESGKKKLQKLSHHRCLFLLQHEYTDEVYCFPTAIDVEPKEETKSQIHGLPGAMEICAWRLHLFIAALLCKMK